jgi:predicted Zn-dependent peptidase
MFAAGPDGFWGMEEETEDDQGERLHQKTVLDNGIRVVTEKIPHLHSVSVGVWVDVGSRDEQQEEVGLTHFIEHMLFKGTERRTALDIAKELDAVGGLSNAFTAKENTCFHAKVLDAHLPLVVDILSDIFLHSVFDTGEIEREREVILQEITLVEDTPDENVHVLFHQAFWEPNPIARSILGDAETVQSFTREMSLGYMHRSYHPERVILSAAGSVDHHEFLQRVGPLFGGLSRTPHPIKRSPPPINTRIAQYPKDLEQVHFCLGTRGTSLVDESRYCCGILNVILGGNMSSRLFQEVRERRGLAYSIYSFLNSHSDSGMLGVYAGVRPDRIEETLDLVRKELGRLKREPISQAELREAKEHIKGGMYLSAESSDNRMSRLAKNEIQFGRFVPYEEIEAGLDRVTSQQVMALAQEIFRPDSMALVLLGPVQGLRVDQTYLEV